MELICESRGRRFYRQAIRRADEFVLPFGGRPYPVLIWTHGAALAPEERRALAGRLIDSGCRYAVCGGVACEAVHDEIDGVFVQSFLDLGPEAMERAHVMITYHEGESPGDVAAFFVLCTSFGQHDFRDYLALHVGGSGAAHAVLDVAIDRVARGPDAT